MLEANVKNVIHSLLLPDTIFLLFYERKIHDNVEHWKLLGKSRIVIRRHPWKQTWCSFSQCCRYDFFWSLDFLSCVSVLASSFGGDINCTFTAFDERKTDFQFDFLEIQMSVIGSLGICANNINQHWCPHKMNLLKDKLRYHQLCSLLLKFQ